MKVLASVEMTLNPKPVVHYHRHGGLNLEVGKHAIVHPIDHPSPLVSNARWSATSKVVRIGENGEFETENTIYVPGVGDH